MPLLDRVMMLISANLNDLLENPESPEKLLKQL
jgi:phage shock protein A